MTSAKSRIIVNTSPIIYLSSINKFGILNKLFSEVIIPDAVRREIIAGGKDSLGYREIQNGKGFSARSVKNELAKKYLMTDIDEGEAEVIVLAEEMKVRSIIMDDRLGRRIASLRGLQVIGTLRLLVLAKEKGIISEVKPLLKRLIAAGFWINDDVFNAILTQSGEK